MYGILLLDVPKALAQVIEDPWSGTCAWAIMCHVDILSEWYSCNLETFPLTLLGPVIIRKKKKQTQGSGGLPFAWDLQI
jgi:hypothetical protein